MFMYLALGFNTHVHVQNQEPPSLDQTSVMTLGMLTVLFHLQLFGAAVTCRIRISEKFYGTGESFLYTFCENGNLKIFPWTGLNNYVVKGNSDSFSIGSGE
jgi:hypothetical protein